MFGQTFDPHDLVIIGLLIVLEGVLSIDNALVLGLLAKRLPKHQQGRALTYGLVGAFVFRIIAIATATYLLKWRIVKLLGGGYLVYVAVKHFFFDAKHPEEKHVTLDAAGQPVLRDETTGQPPTPEGREREIAQRDPLPVAKLGYAPDPAAGRKYAGFWSTVFVIEMTDIAFAIDSILAAIALVGSAPVGTPAGATHPKLWVVIAGGMIGVILMRFAARLFIVLLEKFPRFETSAYLLVIVIGLKLVVDWWLNTEAYARAHPEHPHRVNFHDVRAPEFWIFWLSMLACFAIGFIPKRKGRPAAGAPA